MIYSCQLHLEPNWDPKKEEIEFCFSLHWLDISYIVFFNAPSNSSRLDEGHTVMRVKELVGSLGPWELKMVCQF